MKLWKFKVFIGFNGRDIFEEWINEVKKISDDAEEKIRAMIRRLSVTEKWDRPHFASLKSHTYIFEIIVKTKDKQYRPLGCFGPGPQVFTILVGASKKGKIWSPKDAIKTAKKRRKLIFQDNRRYTGEYQP